MAVQQLTQPILNPIAAFDATKEQTISFVVIGGAQVVANRLVIQDNQTGVEIYSNIESTLKLEHTIPANTLKNGGYYNAVVYTLDNSNTLSSPSTPVPFYCYTQPLLTITNIPATETIENGTYTFEGSYSQIEGELLNSYQFTLYDSNKEVLSQTPLIYYETDSSLSYTFVGMNNDTSYYIELSGQTLNNTSMSTGLLYFTVRYIQPASFAICDLVNDCKDGYVQISSNIVAIDGHSNPDPPIYIDDKEVDLRDPDSYVEWNSGFRIQDDFTMRAWGRDFNDYQNIITLTNDINTEETPNKIELKWMLGDVVKEQLSYEDINGELINVSDSVTAPIKNLEIYGNSIQVDRNADVYVEGKSTQEVQASSFKTATGNPVTITDGELDKPVKLGQIDGLSTQATRSGKNYFDASKIGNTDIVVNDNGQTITMPIITEGNGFVSTIKKLSELCPKLKVGDTVYLLFDKTPDSFNEFIYLLGVDFAWIKGNSRTITQEDLDSTVIMYANRYVDGQTEQVIITNFRIVKNKDDEWEQYGASPSPEFPSEIHSVGDDVNLFDKDNATITSLNCDGGTTFYNAQTTKSIIFDCSKYEQLAISKKIGNYFAIIASSKYPVAGVAGVIGTRLAIDNTKSKDFFSINCKDYNYLTIVFWINTDTITESQMLDTIKIQKGTVATPYSEYGKGTVTIEQSGKNKLDLSKCTFINCKLNNDGTITSNINNSYYSEINTTELNEFIMKNKGMPITFSIKEMIENANVSVVVRGTRTNGTNYQDVNKNNDNKCTVTIADDFTEITGLSLRFNRKFTPFTDTTTTVSNLQVEGGDKATDYEPYFSKDYVIQTAPLRSLPNGTKDTIEEDGIHRRVGSVVLDGSNDEKYIIATSNKFMLSRDCDKGKLFKDIKNDNTKITAISNKLTGISWDTMNDLRQGWYISIRQDGPFSYLRLLTTDIETVSEWKAWLQQNPITVNYELSEEVVEPFTDEQKEVLNSITTQSGTNIFDAQTNMELKYNYNYEIPSPEVESPIKSVGDDVNLAPKINNTNYVGVYPNSTIYADNEVSFDLSAGAGAGVSSIPINVKDLKTISLSAYLKSNDSNTEIALRIYKQDGTTVLSYGYQGKITTDYKRYIINDIDVSDDEFVIIKLLRATHTGITSMKNIKLQKGTVATPYSEYGKGTVTIEQRGKNLFDDNKTYDLIRLTYSNGVYTASDNDTRSSLQYKIQQYNNSTFLGDSSQAYKLITKTGKYYFTLTKLENANNIRIANAGAVSEFTLRYPLDDIDVGEKFTVVIDIIDTTIGASKFKNVMLLKGEYTEETIPDYEPYFSKDYVIPLSEPLRSLPKGTKDILNNKGITRRVGKIVLNGSEHWTGFVSSYKNTIRAQTMISDMSNMGGKADLNIMSSHFLPKDLYGHDIVGIEHIYNELFIRINKYDLDEISLNGFKAWLAAHPTEVIYELATAQNESYEGQTPSPDTPSPIISVGDVKNLIDVPDFNVDYNQQYYQDTNTNFLLKPNYTYTLSFDFNINKSSTDLYYSLGYGTDRYATDITKTTIYSTQTKGRNEITFTVPADIPDNSYLWVRFARTIILADINIDISNIQLEKGKEDTGYQPTTDYNIYPTVSSKNLFDYDNPLYIRTNNLNYNEISNGYHMSPISVGENTEFTIGIENCFNEGDIYALSFSQLGEFGYVAMYKTLKGTQERVNIIDLNNNIFTAPSQNYDLELVFSMSSSALSNSLEIWSIQIEANNTQTTYETHEENSSIITLDTPLNRIGDYADWVGNISPNLLNPVTGSAIVEENTDYFYNKKSTYTASVTIQYKNADGNVISSETLTNDSIISTPENCIEIHIEGLNEQAIKTNHLQIRKGNSNKPYLPYITEPSLIKVTGKIVLDGSENWSLYSGYTGTGYCYQISNPNFALGQNTSMCNRFTNIYAAYLPSVGYVGAYSDHLTIQRKYFISDKANVSDFKAWLAANPTELIYVLAEPEITPLSSLNSEALKTLETYEPISNVYTNNKLLGTLDLDYANGKDMKEVQNAYVLLKCWNGNKMPYVIHSNYIDIPESTENIFIWMRRKKNIFDLKIENLTKGD